MDSFKINYYLQKKYVEKTYAVLLISVIWQNNRIRISLNRSVEEKYWDKKKQKLKLSAPNPIPLNNKLDELRTALNTYYFKQEQDKKVPKRKDILEIIKATITDRKPKVNKNEKKKKPELTFLQYFDEFIADTQSGKRLSNEGKRIQESTITSYFTTRNHLRAFFKTLRTQPVFDDIDEDFFSALSKYLSKENLSNNSQGRFNKVIKTFMHYAHAKELHSNTKFVKALRVFDEDTTIIALSHDELDAIENLQFNDQKEELTEIQKIVKDIYLIQIWTGLRMSDLYNLKPENINYNEKIITIYTLKTQEPLRIPMNSKVIELFKKYNGKLPKMPSQKYNERIKDICKFAGIDSLVQTTKYIGNKRIDVIKHKYELCSSHTARRTFITLTLKKGVLPEMVMKVSGHKSRKSFQRYVRITQEEAIDQVKKAWE